jgi:hypothetical protein
MHTRAMSNELAEVSQRPSAAVWEASAAPSTRVEMTVLMPCLNEARTLKACIEQAVSFFRRTGVDGEVLIADNGSTDGSVALALSLGARVIEVTERGYGAALRAGIDAAQGEYVVMGDSDLSYDFLNLEPFLHALRDGHDLVVGNRFVGGIADGAMPWLHRYLGNPVLSFLGRRFFGGPLRDFHCGLRGFRKSAMQKLELVTPGMEFASEMIVKALQAELRVAEVPTTLAKDGRGRPPHLNTWRDGWRHLRFLLLYSPRWLFLYPGAGLALLGTAQLLYAQVVPSGQFWWPGGIHAQLFAAAAMALGYQTVLFALCAVLARHGVGLDTPHLGERRALRLTRGPGLPLAGVSLAITGLVMCLTLTVSWTRDGFGSLDPETAMRQLIPGVALLLVGTQSILAAIFFAALRSSFDSLRSPRVVGTGAIRWREATPRQPVR